MIWINGVKIKTPTDCSLNRFNLTKSGRTASGLMIMDLISKKKKLELSYEVISGEEMQVILDLIDTDKVFFTVEYELPEGTGKITCYAGAIPSTYFRRKMGWYWKNVSFSLIER